MAKWKLAPYGPLPYWLQHCLLFEAHPCVGGQRVTREPEAWEHQLGFLQLHPCQLGPQQLH